LGLRHSLLCLSFDASCKEILEHCGGEGKVWVPLSRVQEAVLLLGDCDNVSENHPHCHSDILLAVWSYKPGISCLHPIDHLFDPQLQVLAICKFGPE